MEIDHRYRHGYRLYKNIDTVIDHIDIDIDHIEIYYKDM